MYPSGTRTKSSSVTLVLVGPTTAAGFDGGGLSNLWLLTAAKRSPSFMMIFFVCFALLSSNQEKYKSIDVFQRISSKQLLLARRACFGDCFKIEDSFKCLGWYQRVAAIPTRGWWRSARFGATKKSTIRAGSK